MLLKTSLIQYSLHIEVTTITLALLADGDYNEIRVILPTHNCQPQTPDKDNKTAWTR